MMKQYTKPCIGLYTVDMQHFLAGSGTVNQTKQNGDTQIGGNSSEGGGSRDANDNVDDMAKKHYNAWDAWDEL